MEKWYVVKTKARWERKVAEALNGQGIESFCPLKKVQRRWSDRLKTLEEPLFPSCVFVKMAAGQRTLVRLTEGVVNFAYQNGKPALVKTKEIAQLRKLLPELPAATDDETPANQQISTVVTYVSGFQAWLHTCMHRPLV